MGQTTRSGARGSPHLPSAMPASHGLPLLPPVPTQPQSFIRLLLATIHSTLIRYVARLNRSALAETLRPVVTEALPLATPEARSALPFRLHFFSGVPEAERQRLAACAQSKGKGTQADRECESLFDGEEDADETDEA